MIETELPIYVCLQCSAQRRSGLVRICGQVQAEMHHASTKHVLILERDMERSKLIGV